MSCKEIYLLDNSKIFLSMEVLYYAVIKTKYFSKILFSLIYVIILKIDRNLRSFSNTRKCVKLLQRGVKINRSAGDKVI